VSYEKGMTHDNPQKHKATQTMRAKMLRCNMAAQTMAHNGTPAIRHFLPEGEGVGPSAKGQQKRSVHEQFFFL
jgi:hypothetical protein